ncbi:hypothetical protein TcBrA4_0139150 [Trypanosoma cruzi]|nr:hypothetical protein TcBrA4_0139150 [Trypanosoma cruzi]
MRHGGDARRTQSHPLDKRRLDRAAVSMMEHFPIDHKTTLQMRMDVEPTRNRARRPHATNTVGFVWRKQQHGVVPRQRLFFQAAGKGSRCRDSRFGLDRTLEERIKTETMRRVRLLIEQQLRSRQAEAELLQWEANDEWHRSTQAKGW